MSIELFDINSNNNSTADANPTEPIAQRVAEARRLIKANKLANAKILLYDAIRLTEQHQQYALLLDIYDLLLKIAITEGQIADAEEMLVRFIEKLIQLGIDDSDNRIVRYRLRQSRLYQLMGNTGMAEIGYRSCVHTQESKLHTARVGDGTDPYTHQLYLTSLFYYGRFLADGSDFVRAQTYMQRALEHERQHAVLQPQEMMRFLYHSSEIACRLGQYDTALVYLTQAVDVCVRSTVGTGGLAVILVKMGAVFFELQLYDEAKYWCEKGRHFARMHNDAVAEAEANECLKKMLPHGDKRMDD